MTENKQLQVAVMIVGAGSGARALTETGELPKQFFPLEGKTLFQRTVDAFSGLEEISHIVCVVPGDDMSWPLPELSDEHQHMGCSYVSGGATRQLSVLNGLRAMTNMDVDWDIVLVHDAARPFVSKTCIAGVIADAADHGASIAAIPVVDSLKKVELVSKSIGEAEFVTSQISRDGVYYAQTPQGFAFVDLLDAHERALADCHDTFSDDAAVYETYIGKVVFSAGDRNNWKITQPSDFELARQYIRSERANTMIPDVRVGHGYDVHAFEEGTELILCGVTIPHEFSLKGHSDADVALHALTDAVLGALSDGDIGSHFPPSDPKWKAAASDQFLQHAVSLATSRKAVITHLDVTLVCEAPKIGPHRDAMRARVAEITGIEIGRISVKATTSEKLGFTGRKEGISAFATATLVFSAGAQNA